MTPDSFTASGWTAWAFCLSASLAAIGVYDLLYVATAAYKRRRIAKRVAKIDARMAANLKAAEERRRGTRLATATNRREPPIP